MNYQEKTKEELLPDLLDLQQKYDAAIEFLKKEITNLKRAEEKLKESEQRFKTIFENVMIGIFRSTPDGKILLVNPALVKMLGYDSSEELLTRDLEETGYGPPYLRRDFKEIIERDGSISGFESVWKKKDGTTVFVKESAIANYDADGKILFYEGIVEDITERKRTEEKIQENEERFRKIFEEGPLGMVIANSDMHFVKANDAFCKMTGYTEAELIGLTFKDITHPDHLDADVENIRKLFHGKIPLYKTEKRYITKNKSILWGSLISTVVRDINGDFLYFLSMVEDITERKEAEAEKRQMLNDLIAAKEKAEESDRLKSTFLANMGHEIRTPLNIILGFAEQLNDPSLTPEEKTDYLRIIGESGRGLLNIFNDIVCISKVEAGQMPVSASEIKINELFEHIYFSFTDKAEQKGIVILYNKDSSGHETFINTDREKVNTILTNLINNAIKFTNEGFIQIGYEQKGNFLEFYVKDTGVGIKREQQKIIFEPFRQGSESLRRNYEGVGLGLSISKAYVEILGGHIWVESREGIGSAFYFTLPYNPEAAPKIILRPEESEYQEDSSFNNLKILIVEDNEYSAQLLGKIVELNSRGVLNAKTGIEAVEICRNNPDIDLVLMDIQMPGMNGIEATKQIRRFNKDVIIIAQTAFVYTHNRQEAIEAGCNDYISKPIDQALLRNLVKEYFVKN